MTRMNQKNKDLIICFFVAFVGIYGSIIDFNTENKLLPSLWSINIKLDYAIFEREYEMSSVWFIFIMFGIMLIIINILELKSKYKGKALLKHVKKIVGDKIDEGKDEYKIWKGNRNE